MCGAVRHGEWKSTSAVLLCPSLYYPVHPAGKFLSMLRMCCPRIATERRRPHRPRAALRRYSWKTRSGGAAGAMGSPSRARRFDGRRSYNPPRSKKKKSKSRPSCMSAGLLLERVWLRRRVAVAERGPAIALRPVLIPHERDADHRAGGRTRRLSVGPLPRGSLAAPSPPRRRRGASAPRRPCDGAALRGEYDHGLITG